MRPIVFQCPSIAQKTSATITSLVKCLAISLSYKNSQKCLSPAWIRPRKTHIKKLDKQGPCSLAYQSSSYSNSVRLIPRLSWDDLCNHCLICEVLYLIGRWNTTEEDSIVSVPTSVRNRRKMDPSWHGVTPRSTVSWS